MRKILLFLTKLDPRKIHPERGRAMADASVVFVCAAEVVRMAATMIVPIAALILFAIFLAIEE